MRKQVEESVAPGAAARRGRGGRFSAAGLDDKPAAANAARRQPGQQVHCPPPRRTSRHHSASRLRDGLTGGRVVLRTTME